MQVLRAREKHLYLLIEMMRELAMSDVGRRAKPDAELEQDLRRVLEDPEWEILILREDDETPVGYAMFRIAPSNQFPGETVALIHDLLIRRPYRRRYYAKRLYHHVYKRYLYGKTSRIFLTIPSKNDRAIAFWEAMGFKVQGIRMCSEPSRAPQVAPETPANAEMSADREASGSCDEGTPHREDLST